METLADTIWDVVLAGTGLPQSLLALALSRSGKRILHIDRNDYYGGPNASLSLQDAQKFVETVNTGGSLYSNAYISTSRAPAEGGPANDHGINTQLACSRAYSLCLSPQIIYARSSLLSGLVASKSFRHLEFLAAGSWWLYESVSNLRGSQDANSNVANIRNKIASGRLGKIPGSKEDVFGDDTINRKNKRALTNFLRFATHVDEDCNLLEDWRTRPFEDFLTSRYELTPTLRAAVSALTLMPMGARTTTTLEAMQRISQHLSSFGVLGSGFNAVLPRWGGLGEIVQVACRAGAVGGGIYALGKGINEIFEPINDAEIHSASGEQVSQLIKIGLDGGFMINSTWLVGCQGDLPHQANPAANGRKRQAQHNISIISSPLSKLFLGGREEATLSAVAVITFPPGTILISSSQHDMELPPVYLQVHSSDTGECPNDQCVLYTSVWAPRPQGKDLIDGALERVLEASGESGARILWSLDYTSSANIRQPLTEQPSHEGLAEGLEYRRILTLPNLQPNIFFDDDVLEHVRHAWTSITGEVDGFLNFDDVGELRLEDNDSFILP